MAGGFDPLPLRLRSVDPLSDWSAEDHARLCADMSASVPMMTKAKMRLKFLSTGNVFTVEEYRGLLPISTISSTGTVHSLRIKAGGADAYGKPGTFRVEHVKATMVEGSTSDEVYPAIRLRGNNIIDIRIHNPDLNAIHTGDFELFLYVG